MLLEKYAGFAGAAQAAMRNLTTGLKPKPMSAVSKAFWGKAAKPGIVPAASKVLPRRIPSGTGRPATTSNPRGQSLPRALPGAVSDALRRKKYFSGVLKRTAGMEKTFPREISDANRGVHQTDNLRQIIRQNLTRSR